MKVRNPYLSIANITHNVKTSQLGFREQYTYVYLKPNHSNEWFHVGPSIVKWTKKYIHPNPIFKYGKISTST
jgi:hypothetical protein